MIIDILILLPWVAFGALGFRDASARKLVAIATCIVALFLGQWLMHDLGTVFRNQLNVPAADAPVRDFMFIFFFSFFLQAVLYRLLTGNYKFGGIIDRIIGVPLGLLEGGLIISTVIFILAMQGPPSRKTIWDSKLYHPTASITPQIMDWFSFAFSQANDSFRNVTGQPPKDLDTLDKDDLEKLTSPGGAKVDSVLHNRRQ